MRKELLIIALGLLSLSGSATAEVLATPDAPAATAIDLPKKGSSMAEVEKKFGAPVTKRPTVGGDTPKHPPITRWDYADFYVIFEKDKTVDAVVPGKHPAVYHKDELKPAEKPSETSAIQPAVPAEAPVMQTRDMPIAPVEQPAVAEPKEATPPASEAKVVTAPAESAPAAPAEPPAPAAPEEAAPAPAPAPSSGSPAVAKPVPDSPPTPK